MGTLRFVYFRVGDALFRFVSAWGRSVLLRFGLGMLRFASFRLRDALFCFDSACRHSVSPHFGLGMLRIRLAGRTVQIVVLPLLLLLLLPLLLLLQVLEDSKSGSSRFLDEDVGSESHCLLHSETRVTNKEHYWLKRESSE